MPYRRKSKRAPRKKRRTYRRKYRSTNSKSFKFVRSMYYGSISSQAAIPTLGALSFSLGSLPNYTEFTALFDEYKISKITIRFIRHALMNNVDTAYSVPDFHTVVDKDDASSLTTVNEFMQCANCRIGTASSNRIVRFVPKFANTVYNTAITSGYGAKTGWLDCNSADVPHFGLKYYMGSSTVASAYKYLVYVTYTIHCRGIR